MKAVSIIEFCALTTYMHTSTKFITCASASKRVIRAIATNLSIAVLRSADSP